MYNSKYYSCEEIDERLLQGTYDDAVAAGFTGTKVEFDAIAAKAATNINPGYMTKEHVQKIEKNVMDIGNLTTTHEQDKQNIQKQLDKLFVHNLSLTGSVDPNLIFEGESHTVTINANIIGGEKGNITITKGGITLVTKNGVDKVTITDNINTGSTYDIKALVRNLPLLTQQVKVTATKPIYIGSGSVYTEVVTVANKQSERLSPVGTYNVNVKKEGDHVFIVVPSNMSVNKVTMSGFDMIFKNPDTQSKPGYKVYESANVYQAGTVTIVIVK